MSIRRRQARNTTRRALCRKVSKEIQTAWYNVVDHCRLECDNYSTGFSMKSLSVKNEPYWLKNDHIVDHQQQSRSKPGGNTYGLSPNDEDPHGSTRQGKHRVQKPQAAIRRCPIWNGPSQQIRLLWIRVGPIKLVSSSPFYFGPFLIGHPQPGNQEFSPRFCDAIERECT